MHNNDVLLAIDEIHDVISESDIHVLDALLNSYDKATTIVENYQGSDLSSFSVFQEGGILDDVKKKQKDDPLIMKILLFIPRIVIATFKALRKKISGMKMDDITKEISPKKLKKCKEKPGLFKRIITSKPMKTISLISGVSLAIATEQRISNIISVSASVKKNMKDIKTINDQDYRNKIINEFKENYHPVVNIQIDDDNRLCIETTFDLGKANDVVNKYMDNVRAILRKYTIDMRQCKLHADVEKVLSECNIELMQNNSIYEYLCNDEKHYIARYDQYRKSLIDTRNSLKTFSDDEKNFQSMVEELVNAIPYNHLTSIDARAEVLGKNRQKIEEIIQELTQNLVYNIQQDILVFANIINGIKCDVDEVVKSILEFDENDPNAMKQEMKKAVSGKYKYDVNEETGKVHRIDSEEK